MNNIDCSTCRHLSCDIDNYPCRECLTVNINESKPYSLYESVFEEKEGDK